MLTETEKDYIDAVAMFLSGRIKQKSQKEEAHKRRVHYLIDRLGYKRFKKLVMRKVREIGVAGPCFMYRCRLDVKRQLLDLNEHYRRRLVNPIIYDAIESIPDINFASFVGADIPEAELIHFDVRDMQFQDVQEENEEVQDEDEEVKVKVELPPKEKEEMESSQDDGELQDMEIDNDIEVKVEKLQEEEMESSDESTEEVLKKKRKTRYDEEFVDVVDEEDSDEEYIPDKKRKH